MRHAKSSWSDESLNDHQRPLNKRGLANAPAMADFLLEKGWTPDLILSSGANRALSTAKIVAQQMQEHDIPLHVVDEFYLALPDTYVDVLGNLDDQFSRPMVIGHNPGLESLVNVLTQQHEFMSTAAVAVVRFSFERWTDLDSSLNGELVDLYRPKEVL